MALRGNVDYVHPELSFILPQYNLISDCLAGETIVKSKGALYLPRPNAADVSKENLARYDAYLLRATFYNVAERTLEGTVGQIFIRDPEIKVPTRLDIVTKDVSGEGVTLIQQAKEACNLVMSKGRAGLYVDYPKSDKPASVLDVESGNIRPTIALYKPENIINWRTKKFGAKTILSLVVLLETYTPEDEKDNFEVVCKKQWRVLRLEANGDFVVEVYREEKPADIYETINPKDSKGQPLKEIPFTFIGVNENSVTVDKPPLYSLCSLNVAHYQTMADYRESCYMVGQATPVVAGLTQEWYNEVLKGVIQFGSRGGIPLPVGATFELAQASEQSMQFEALQHLEKQMVGLGAKLVENQDVQRTLGEAKMENTAEMSVLASTAKNVGAAYTWALEWAAIFAGLSDTTTVTGDGRIEFDLNSEFDLVSLTAEERKQLLAEWQGGAITFSEYRASLLRAGIATLSDEDAQAELEAEGMTQIDMAAREAEALAEAVPKEPA